MNVSTRILGLAGRSLRQTVSVSQRSVYGARSLVTGGKKEWLCIMPDKAGVADLRKKVKGGHYEGIQPLIKAGKLVAGGGIFENHPAEGEAPKFRGSVVVYTGETPGEVQDIIESDIYATSGVWDLDKVQIIPYVPAVREALSK